MSSDRTVVSVVIPTWNRAATIERAVGSVLGQTFPGFEVLIVDDGSTDGTGQLYERPADRRVKYLRSAVHSGAQAARNLGIQAARGEWIAFLDSDDYVAPRRLEAALAVADSSPGRADVICVGGTIVQPDGTEAVMRTGPLSGDVYAQLLSRPGPVLAGLMVRRKLLLEIGGLDSSLQAFQEWDTHIRLAAVRRFEWTEEPLFYWVRHEGESISNNFHQNATGFAQNVEKHASATVEVCGRARLATLYACCAGLFRNVGDHIREVEFLRKSLRVEEDRQRIQELEQSLRDDSPLERKFDIPVYGC
ncbi:MAG: glycosyltransferase family 2 protein [Planctomycetaceae bacterium]|nr:glycosyltransferase family 2 protein [Planctomycetaceae bacterium]